MSAPVLPRRGFLSGLATLPLIGGGLTLIGQPTAAAVPVTDALLDAYDEWLFVERRMLVLEKYGHLKWERCTPANTAASLFHFPVPCTDWRKVPKPSTRAAVILSAAGVVL